MTKSTSESLSSDEPHSQPVTHIVLACDESGAKGYAGGGEKYPGEVGVFAGLMVPGEKLVEAQSTFDALVTKYAPPNGKLHVADLPSDRQAALRTDVYDLIRNLHLPCFYEAIHVAGFDASHQNLLDAIAANPRPNRSAIKRSSNPKKAPSLHVALFQGIYSKVLAFCMERDRLNLHIEIRTDNVDDPIAKEFYRSARSLLDYGAKVKIVKGYDPVAKKVVEGRIETGAAAPSEQLPIMIDLLELEIKDDTDGLVVAADVLANSLNYHFKNRPADRLYTALNTPEAFATHPLYECLDSYWDWGVYNFTDSYYRHPLDLKLNEA
jgi:hypothetical protein